MRYALIFTLLLVTMWSLHGLDMQFYTIQSAYWFDINLYLAVMCIVSTAVITAWEPVKKTAPVLGVAM